MINTTTRIVLVPIDKIYTPKTRHDLSNYVESQFIRGADLALQLRTIINPIIVEPFAGGRYLVINGFFEYFCAVRANSIAPDFNAIPALIIDSDNRGAIENQMALFREDDNFIDDYFEMDFELVEDEDIEKIVSAALHGKTLDECFEAAEGLVDIYPAGSDKDRARKELEELKQGDRTYQARLDKFFTEAGGLYE